MKGYMAGRWYGLAYPKAKSQPEIEPFGHIAGWLFIKTLRCAIGHCFLLAEHTQPAGGRTAGG